jgi:predicted enzyme related to lactoylglutathione lyase
MEASMGWTGTATHIELTLDDVWTGVRFFRQVLGLPVRLREADHAEVRLSEELTAHLRTLPAASATPGPVPGQRRPGTVLQLEVAELETALAELRRRGATVLVDAVLTDWGTHSAFIAGPDDLVVEVYSRATS